MTTYAPPDEAQLDAMEPGMRMQYLGNGLYPQVATLVGGEPLAGKITGMLLELPTKAILENLASPETLKQTVGEAMAALPADVVDQATQEAMAVSCCCASPEPRQLSTPTMSTGPSFGGSSWGDDCEDEEPLPSFNEMLANAENKRASKREADACGDAMETEDDFVCVESDGFVCEWDGVHWAKQPADKLCDFVAKRLHEPQVRIVRAVVELLGPIAALNLLVTTERCVHNGGMVVARSGKPRTPGGIFFKLLKDSTDLPQAAQAAALLRIKKEGDDAKKAHRKQLAEKRRSSGKPESPTAAAVASSPHTGKKADQSAVPKPSLGDFLVASQPQFLRAA